MNQHKKSASASEFFFWLLLELCLQLKTFLDLSLIRTRTFKELKTFSYDHTSESPSNNILFRHVLLAIWMITCFLETLDLVLSSTMNLTCAFNFRPSFVCMSLRNLLIRQLIIFLVFVCLVNLHLVISLITISHTHLAARTRGMNIKLWQIEYIFSPFVLTYFVEVLFSLYVDQ